MSRPEWDKLGRLWQKLEEHATKFQGLGVLQVLPIKTPAGHPDLDDFDTDMADMEKLSRFAKTEAKTVLNRNWSRQDIVTHIGDNTLYASSHRRMVQEHNDKGRTSPETALLQDFMAFRDLGVQIRRWA